MRRPWHRQPLFAAVKQIEDQTGYKLVTQNDKPDAMYTFEMTGGTYWEALDYLSKESGLAVVVDRRDRNVHLRPRKKPMYYESSNGLFQWNSGPFQLVVGKMYEHLNVDFAEVALEKDLAERDDFLTLEVALRVEPRYLVLVVENPQVEIAIDENGKSFGKADRPKDEERSFGKRTMCCGDTAFVCLHRTDKNSTKIREIRGWIPIRVVIERKRILVTSDFLTSAGTEFKLGGETLEVVSATQDVSGRLRMVVSAPPQDREIDWRWSDRFHVEDAKGNAYVPRFASWPSSRIPPDSLIGLDFQAPKDPKVGPPAKLFVEQWKIVDYRIPFEFKNLPLP